MSLVARTTLALSSVALLLACGDDEATPTPPPAPATEAPHAELDIDDPEACGTCHAEIVAEWQTSMHAHAHHDADPIYGAMRRLRMIREGDAIATRCAQCHGPRDPADPSSATAQTGVSCASCHSIAAIDRAGGTRRGAGAITWADDGTLRGPFDLEGASPPHPVGDAAPWITDGRTLCLTCHDAMQNAEGVATCTTGTEHAAARADATCTSCHMPTVAAPGGPVSPRRTHRSHAFLGPHHLWADADAGQTFLASAIEASATLDGTSLRLTLVNRAGHSVPSGFPGRMVVVRAAAHDASGAVTWRNFEADPMAEDADAVLNKVYVDAEGSPTMPPYGARLARDTRLGPSETRELQWTVPEGVTRAEIQILYRLMPGPAAARLGLQNTPLADIRPFLALTARR